MRRPSYPLDWAGVHLTRSICTITLSESSQEGHNAGITEAYLGKGLMLRFKARSADKGTMGSVVSARASAQLRGRMRERGQALVEFALIMPLFVLLLMGIIQFGIALNYWLDMQRLANQGARWAVVNQWPADPDGGGPKLGMSGACLTDPTAPCSQTLQAYLRQERVSGGLQPCVNITFPNPTSEVGDPVAVELSAGIRFLKMPFVVLPGIKITSKATMRLEQKPGRYQTGVQGPC